MVVVAARGALDGSEGLAAVGRAIGRGVGDIDDVFVFRIDFDLGKVAAASPGSPFIADLMPILAGIF